MLSIGKLGRGQEDYYLATVAKGVEDYYTGAGEAPGEWMGAGAARLGLAGQAAPEQLRAVLGGVHPVRGTLLGGHTRKDRVPGWDLTFSAPKSVSVLWALGGEEVARAAVEAHREAVAAGLGYLGAHATTSRRRVHGAVELVRGEGLVVAAFRHRTSRAGDPHLHTHCLAANVVERVDGGFGALHSPVVYRHARTAGFVYQGVLRAELTERLAVEWGPVRKGCAEIEGIEPALLDPVLQAPGRDRGGHGRPGGALGSRRPGRHPGDPAGQGLPGGARDPHRAVGGGGGRAGRGDRRRAPGPRPSRPCGQPGPPRRGGRPAGRAGRADRRAHQLRPPRRRPGVVRGAAARGEREPRGAGGADRGVPGGHRRGGAGRGHRVWLPARCCGTARAGR